jgi:Flp pilus assembly protein CpaB
VPALSARVGIVTARRRRRVAALAALALAVVGLTDPGADRASPQPAASQAVVLLRPVAAGKRFSADDLGVLRVPSISLAQAQITDPAAVIGRPAAIDLPAGTPLSTALVTTPSGHSSTRDVAVRLDGLAGVPSGAAGGGLADLYLTAAGPRPRTSIVLRGVLVISAAADAGEATATLRVPTAIVDRLIVAESSGSLRLVLHAGAP